MERSHFIEQVRAVVQRAKVFKNGRSRAIRLPEEFRVEADEVYLKKTPEGFLVMTRDPWEIFFEGVRELSDEFPSGGRSQPPAQRRQGEAIRRLSQKPRKGAKK